jgi:peptide/nickel transport system permease protein
MSVMVGGVPRYRRLSRRLATSNLGLSAAVVVAGSLVIVAVLAPLLAPAPPNKVDPLNLFAGISSTHLLGTDDTGRDILSRLMYGGRLSLLAPAIIMAIAGVAGTLLAVSSAWFSGWWDALVARFLDLLFGFPGLILAIITAAVFGSGLIAPVLALSVAYIPYVARILRTTAQRERRLSYVEALQMQGVSPLRICLRHIIPNLAPMIIVQIAVGFGYAMLDFASISFLGLGIQPPTPEWGLMVSDGQSAIIDGHPGESLFAGLAIVIAVVAFNVIGEHLSTRLVSDAP